MRLRQPGVVVGLFGLDHGKDLTVGTVERVITDAGGQIDRVDRLGLANLLELGAERLPSGGVIAVDRDLDLIGIGNVPAGALQLRIDLITASDGFVLYHDDEMVVNQIIVDVLFQLHASILDF